MPPGRPLGVSWTPFGPLWTTLGSHGVALGALLALLGSSKGLPWTQILDFRVILGAFFTYFLRLVLCVCVASSSLDFPSDFHDFPWIFDHANTWKITFLLQTCRKNQGFAGRVKSLIFHVFFSVCPSISN